MQRHKLYFKNLSPITEYHLPQPTTTQGKRTDGSDSNCKQILQIAKLLIVSVLQSPVTPLQFIVCNHLNL